MTPLISAKGKRINESELLRFPGLLDKALVKHAVGLDC